MVMATLQQVRFAGMASCVPRHIVSNLDDCPPSMRAERERLVRNLGQNDALILRNHGLLVCGRTVGEAFHLIQRLEVACQVQVDVMAAGQEICFPSAQAQDTTETLLGRQADDLAVSVGGKMEWEAMVRELNREDPSYAQ